MNFSSLSSGVPLLFLSSAHVALKADRVETTDGVWLFEGWTPEEIEKLTADTAFTGTWTFAKNAGGINHIPVITAEDKTLTVGDSFDVMAGEQLWIKRTAILRIRLRLSTIQ